MTNKKEESKATETIVEDTPVSEPIQEDVDLVKEALKQANTYKEMALRAQADFDNYRKRNLDATRRAREDGIIDTIVDILPVLDNLERAVVAITDDNSRKGVNMIVKQFNSVLDSMGIKEIETDNKPFDPNLHNAVATANVDGVDSGIVVEVLQKGYKYNDKVIRHAMVKVSE